MMLKPRGEVLRTTGIIPLQALDPRGSEYLTPGLELIPFNWTAFRIILLYLYQHLRQIQLISDANGDDPEQHRRACSLSARDSVPWRRCGRCNLPERFVHPRQ